MISDGNLCKVLENAGRNNAGIVFINEKGGDRFLSYKDLYERAKGILHNIKEQGITRDNEVVIQTQDNESFITVFWGCILGGIIPVPLHVGMNKEQKSQLFNVFKVLKNPKLIIDKEIYSEIGEQEETEKPGNFIEKILKDPIVLEDIIIVTKYDEVLKPQPSDIAYIQFSSGSTGNPKGITITHENVTSNVKAIYNRVQCNEKDSLLNWLPISHSFSLTVGHITSMYAQINQYLMPTLLFLKNPLLWMEKASQYKNTILLTPNFGFNHFLNSMDKEREYSWDLSGIKIMATGSEPIDVNLCREFSYHMKKYGMGENTIWPSYGMTEATVSITSPLLGDKLKAFRLERNSIRYGNRIKEISSEDVKNVMNVVSVGYPYKECQVRICNQKDDILKDRYIGSIQIKGKNVTKGYYNNEAETRAAFTKDGWLKTGDIGFLYENQLVVTGREKDIIFINGQNYYPVDIERIVKEIKELTFDEIAACGIFNKEKQKEEIVIFILTKEKPEAFASKVPIIKGYINNCTGLEVSNVIPVTGLPKAGSGKILRYKLAEEFINGSFDAIMQALSIIREDNLPKEIKKPGNKAEEILVNIWTAVLKIKDFGVDVSFFELGGDSLKAAFMVQSISKEFNKDISLKDIFDNPTIEELADYIKEAEISSYEEIQPAKEKEYYPLSSAQKRLYALYELDKKSISYNITQVVIAKGNVDPKKVKEAFNALIQRHKALRTSFEVQGDEIREKINSEMEIDFSYKEAGKEHINEEIEEFIRPFSLNKAPLFRTGLIKTDSHKYYILLDIHHIIADGISISILLKEFLELYNQPDKRGEAAENRLDYVDYAQWQADNRNSEKMEKQKAYWLDQLKGRLPLLNLPTDFKRPSKQQFGGNSVLFRLNQDITRALKELSRNTNTTLYMVLFGAFTVFLHKYAKQDEVMVGTVSAGRNATSLKDVVGMFVNTLAIRSKIEEETSFSAYLQGLKEVFLGAVENSDYQFDQLIEDLEIKRDLSRNPVFDVMFVMENIDIPDNGIEDIKFSIYDYNPKGTKLDLTLKVQERDGEIICLFQYNTSLFKEETINRFAEYYKKILKEIICSVEKKVWELSIIPEEEREKVLKEFNATKVNYKDELTILNLFRDQVNKTPHKKAVVCKGEELTYHELNQKSNSLARTLRQQGVEQEEIVGLLVERSIHMIVGILAIMKAGGAYLPIDLEYPEDRIAYMLKDSNVKVLITGRELKEGLRFSGCILDIEDSRCYAKDTGNLEPICKGNHLSYVIYTSGSTGRPKGVAIEHHSLVNYTLWFKKKGALTEKDKTILISSFAFDLSYTSLYSALLSGCELHILSKEEYRDPEKLLNYINIQGITYIKATPSLFGMLVNTYSFSLGGKCNRLRLIVLGGEPINVNYIEKYKEIYPDIRIMNHYGPTECTIGCIATLIDMDKLEDYKKHPVIGKPIDNAKVYILDENREPVAIGQTGEIYIGGPGLARGYINREELNKEKFRENPFKDSTALKLYKTGDLGRYLSDGTIEFLGRIDSQVKIRGYRIELKEIESSIAEYPGIERAAVVEVAEEYGDKEVCAYFVSKEDILSQDLRRYLTTRLPFYMIPSYFVQVEDIPLTFNGKVNKEALPGPVRESSSDAVYEEPGDDTKGRLLKLWREVLGFANSGNDSNFFEAGGHSLKATVLILKIRKEFNITIEMKDIFDNPTIRELSQCINKKRRIEYSDITVSEKKAFYPVSSAQKRIYTLAQIESESIGYNMPSVYMIEGRLHKKRLKDALLKLIQRHEILRTTFHVMDGEIVQKIHEEAELDFRYEEGEKEADTVIREFVTPFSLDVLPMFRIKVVKIKEEVHMLLMDMHHIIFDGVSISIFINELNHLYNGKSLKDSKIQYKDYAVWEQKLLASKEMESKENYWLNTFFPELPKASLSLDYKRPKLQSFNGASIKFEIDSHMKKKLVNLNKKTGTTLFMVLFGAYSILLSKYSNQEDIITGTAGAGRHHEDLQNLIGMFVSTLPVRTYPKGDKSIKQYLEEVKNICFGVFENAEYPFDKLLEKLNVKRETGRNPLFDTMFILENVESLSIDMKGLSFRPYELKNTTAKFDLMLVGEEREDKIQFEFKYSTVLFKSKTVERLRDSYIRILTEMTEDYEKKLLEIDYIKEREKEDILYRFNHKKAYYPKDKTIAELYEEQVRLSPKNIAVVFKKERISYEELDKRANSIANMLIARGVGKDSIVGIIIKRSVNMIVAILGILKAGGAYMPISEEYPGKRIQYMLEDSKALLLLTESDLIEKADYLDNTVCNVTACNGACNAIYDTICDAICIDEEEIYSQYSCKKPLITRDSSALAYVIYTSGTTGSPKGVMIENKSVVNLIYALQEKIYKNYEEHLNIALLAPYMFDASVKQIFASLLLGHTLHIIPEEVRMDGEMLVDYYTKNNIAVSDGTPTHLSILTNCTRTFDGMKMKSFIIGGEALHNNLVANFLSKFRKEDVPDIINVYGPTECCVDATLYCISKENQEEEVLIGEPLNNVKLYVLDKYKKIVPVGIPGELYIGGEGVGRGYLNKPDLTREKFSKDPFYEGGRIYKTGDLGLWTEGGRVKYIDRMDNQVKIRGFRIELGEIEKQLLKQEGIEEAVVIAKEDEQRNKYLCAYVITSSNITGEELRSYLLKELPDYMIPAYFIFLDKMPVTPNGKLDKGKLPEVDLKLINEEVYIEPPENEIQEMLVKVWCQVLGLPRIGINSNYYSLGGDSIKAIQISAKLREYNLKLMIKDLLQYQTIKELSNYISYTTRKASQEIVTGKVLLTPIQKAFFENQYRTPNHYNQSVLLYSRVGFKENFIETVFTRIVKHHDALRMIFKKEGGKIIQWNREEGEVFCYNIFETEEKDYKGYIERKISKIQRSLNIEEGPLVSLGLFKTWEGDYLLIVIHHLIVDGVSFRILLEDFTLAYKQLEKGQEIRFPDKTDSYKTWGEEIYRYAYSDELKAQLNYWSNLEQLKIPPLIKDKAKKALRNLKECKTKSITLEEAYTDRLLKETNRVYNTEINDILLTALAKTIRNFTNREQLLINLEGHGREPIKEDLDVSRTMGWFTSKYPVLLDIGDCCDLREEIKKVKETLRRVPLKGIGYSILRYITLKEYEASFKLEPEICFNYLGQFDNNIKNDLFTIAELSSGDNISKDNDFPYALSVGGMILQNKLVIKFTYPSEEFLEETIDNLLSIYINSLKEIIDHCSLCQEQEYTPSDFDDDSLSLGELENINEILMGIEV